MNKRLIGGAIAAFMMFSNVSIFAGTTPPATIWTPGYLPGEIEHLVDVDDCLGGQLSDATIESDGVSITEGGSASWGFFLPYSARSVKVSYSGSGNITVSSNDNTYNTVALSNGINTEHILTFGENLGYDEEPQYRTWGNSYGFLREYVEHSGEKNITIKLEADGEIDSSIKIHSLKFEKELTMGPNSSVITQFSEDENLQNFGMETMSTVLIHEDAPVIVVNGGRRYIDNNEITKEPYNFNGSMYLPINTLAKALGYYCEVIPKEGYALMRNGSHEVFLMGGKCTITHGQATPVFAPDDVFIYREGEILAAVRYFGELCGETVGYKNGLVVIDDKYTVRDILENDLFYAYAGDKLMSFTANSKQGNTYCVI